MERIDFEQLGSEGTELVARAAAGERLEFVRDGRVIAALSPRVTVLAERDRQAALKEIFAELDTLMPPQAESAADLVRRMRDDERY